MASILGDTKLQSTVLEHLTDAVNYQAWLADTVRPYLGDDPLEVGSGIGSYASLWLPGVSHFTVTEGDPERLDVLRQRFVDEPKVTVRELLLPAAQSGSHSSIVALNVWEHIEEQVDALRSVTDLLRPGGAVVLVVPAFEFAMSRFDREIGHVRRYTVRSMRETLTAAGLRVHEVRYLNPVGLISWVLVCKVLRQRPQNGALLRFYDRFVVPKLRRAEQGRRPRFGQSVFAVAYKD